MKISELRKMLDFLEISGKTDIMFWSLDRLLTTRDIPEDTLYRLFRGGATPHSMKDDLSHIVTFKLVDRTPEEIEEMSSKRRKVDA